MFGDSEARLASAYEGLRRREYELITGLLDLLPRIDSLDQERVSQVRDALFHADHPYLMVFVGPFSSGKSSIINALLGDADLLPVGPVPTTDRITILRWAEEPGQMRSGDVDTVFHPSPLLRKVSFVDTPGLESVFKEHEETTRRFLHRSDTVVLTMLATQAMTQRNLEYLRVLKEYGKNVIVIINQADLLTPEEGEAVRQYVIEQGQAVLGAKPQVWLMSARLAQAARAGDELDEAQWQASGVNKLEDYVDEQLSDVARLRQKLQTPLLITRNVHQAALETVRGNQSALDHYQNIADNIEQQLAGQKREQGRIIREVNEEVSAKFGAAALRGSEAIRETFQLARALGSTLRGVLELVGLGGLARHSQGGSYIRAAYEGRRTFEPIAELPATSGKLASRLEGKDVSDLEDLVKYARREIDALPPAIQSKVIGTVQAPVQYDRTALQEIRDELDEIAGQAREIETNKIEQMLRNTLLFLAAWELTVIILLVLLFSAWEAVGEAAPAFLLILLTAGLLGFLILPLRGRMLENTYTGRMLALQARYIELLSKAADRQTEYSMNLRRQVVQPLTRLVEAQTQIQTEQLNKLQQAQQEITKIEGELAALGKPRLVGMRG